MTSVVKSSSSVYSTYISTIDHLPCDIVRSLWLVQACNVAADAEKQKLDESLKEYKKIELQLQENRKEIIRQYRESQEKITRWNNEAIAELENLGLQLKTHEIMLRRGVDSLNDKKQHLPLPDQKARNELLKKQLEEHYKENPLASQIEALQERVIKGSRNVIIKHMPGSSAGVKIILKPPKAQAKESSGEAADGAPAPMARMTTRSQKPQVFSQPSSPVPKIEILTESKDIIQPKKRLRSCRSSMNTAVAETQEPTVPKDEIVLTTVSPPEVFVSEIPVKPVVTVTPTVSSKAVKSSKPAAAATTITSKVVQTRNAPEKFCFCQSASSGDMIACDYSKCPNGEWFHYKCVRLSRADAQKFENKKWYCSDTCRANAEKYRSKRSKRKAQW